MITLIKHFPVQFNNNTILKKFHCKQLKVYFMLL